jgi:hypothetical protein
LGYLALLVVIALVFTGVALLGGSVLLGLRWLGRHQSRTSGQESTVYALNMALVGIVVASRQCFEATAGNGQRSSPPRVGGPWLATDARLRPTVERNLPLVEDASGEPVVSAAAARSRSALTLRLHDGRVPVRPEPPVG